MRLLRVFRKVLTYITSVLHRLPYYLFVKLVLLLARVIDLEVVAVHLEVLVVEGLFGCYALVWIFLEHFKYKFLGLSELEAVFIIVGVGLVVFDRLKERHAVY